jgi:cytochrome P450
LPIYDPFSVTTEEDPYPTYRLLRDQHPVYRNDERDLWIISRFEDVQAAARDWKTFSSAGATGLDDVTKVIGTGDFLDSDPPHHDRLRNLVRRRFMPSRVSALEPTIRSQAQRLIDAFSGSGGTTDLATEFAWKLPVAVMSDILGVPRADQQVLTQWIISFLVREKGNPAVPSRALAATEAIKAYFTSLYEEHKGRHGDAILYDLAAAEAAGEVHREEVAGMCLLFAVAGTETTAGLLATSLMLLARHPDQRAHLVKDSTGLPTAIEELLRYDAPVQLMGRVATRDVDVRGVTIPSDGHVVLLFGSANRDERRFPEPDRLDVTRKPKRHLAFGEGIHFCLGAPVARLEARIALEELLARAPNFEIAGEPVRLPTHGERGFVSLPATV